MKIEVLELARREFDDAYAYYEGRKKGLGEEFREAIKAQVLAISHHPDAWLRIRPGLRKCPGKRFPYDVIYQQLPSQILILALAHKKRRPFYWADRQG